MTVRPVAVDLCYLYSQENALNDPVIGFLGMVALNLSLFHSCTHEKFRLISLRCLQCYYFWLLLHLFLEH
ncbi:hypothetical protein GJAV_G00222410 [Gymnothorax javanicus]|nr:hypothetical protein GJAV_G00222410 [Gymnothorax javanicus]